MPTDTEQLVVSLEARIRDFERNFQRANRTSSQNFQAIERQAKRSADTLEQTMSKASSGVNVALAGLKGGVAGIVAGLSIGALQGVVSRIGDVTKGIANIGSEAKRAGLSTRAFQELGVCGATEPHSHRRLDRWHERAVPSCRRIHCHRTG